MKAILSRLFNHEELTRKEAKNLLLNITRGMYNDAQIAALLTVFQMRGIKVEELIGFREAFSFDPIHPGRSHFDDIHISIFLSVQSHYFLTP